MKRKSPAVEFALTQRAVNDLDEIERYSSKNWGARVANRYLRDIEQALDRIGFQPSVLQSFEGLPERFKYYLVRSHMILCDIQGRTVVILAVVHASMDLPRQFTELQPRLSAEVEYLHGKLRTHRKK